MFFCVSNAFAAPPTISISPPKFELTLEPGQIIEDKIIVKNKGQDILPLQAKTVNWTGFGEEGGIEFSDIDNISFTPAKWFELTKTDFILGPGEMVRVNFKIQVPANAEPGGYYTGILFQPKYPSTYFEPHSAHLLGGVGALFLLSLPSAERAQEPIKLEEFSLGQVASLIRAAVADEEAIIEKGPIDFILRIKNNDIVHLQPKGEIKIRNIFGQEIAQIKVPEKTILPGMIRKFPVSLDKKYLWGRYRAELEMSQGDYLLTASLGFWAFPWKYTLLWITLAGLVIFFMIKFRKRFILAFKTLIERR